VHYLELKALMMREGQTKGYISRQEARTFFRLEPAKAVRQAQPSFFLLVLCFFSFFFLFFFFLPYSFHLPSSCFSFVS